MKDKMERRLNIALLVEILIIALAFTIMYIHSATAQERIRNPDGTTRYTIVERNDGSRVVKDNTGRVVRIIRERNDGTTVVHRADGSVAGTSSGSSYRDSLEKQK